MPIKNDTFLTTKTTPLSFTHGQCMDISIYSQWMLEASNLTDFNKSEHKPLGLNQQREHISHWRSQPTRQTNRKIPKILFAYGTTENIGCFVKTLGKLEIFSPDETNMEIKAIGCSKNVQARNKSYLK